LALLVPQVLQVLPVLPVCPECLEYLRGFREFREYQALLVLLVLLELRVLLEQKRPIIQLLRIRLSRLTTRLQPTRIMDTIQLHTMLIMDITILLVGIIRLITM
jgi:hypothetical protein